MKILKKLMRNRFLALADIIFIWLSYIFVFFVCDRTDHLLENLIMVGLTCVVYLIVFYLFLIYRRWWPYGSVKDYAVLLGACAVAGIIVLGVELFFEIDSMRLRECLCANITIMFCIIFVRASVRMLDRYMKYVEHDKVNNGLGRRTLVYGAGAGAMLFLRELDIAKDYTCSIVGLVDDDPRKKHLVLFGYRVMGTGNDVKEICEKYDVDDIVIAMPAASPETKKRIVSLCSDTGRNVKIVPSLDEMVNGKQISSLRRIKIEDLLAREPIKLNNGELSHLISGKTVAVTGGGGSIGSELCRQIAKYNPYKLVIIDIYENNAYDLQNELKSEYPDLNMEVLIASVRDKKRIDEIFAEFKPSIIFHAAAHKHVPLMEDSPAEAVKNNVFGTFNVARSAMENNIERFVMISTDKAVNPTNVMGATKRMCEMIVQSMQGKSKTDFVAVRFGNVLGSNGSVIPLFKRQIEKGGPITLTDKRIIRYFMTIPEAAQLVLQAASYAEGGEIFVLDMGEPVKIYDLAENLIKLSGYKPGIDIEIKEVGLRPGEKLYEELLMSEEGLKDTKHKKIFIGKSCGITYDEILEKLSILENALGTQDNLKIKEAVATVVPTYKIDKR